MTFKRWTASRKQDLINEVIATPENKGQILARVDMTEEEFDSMYQKHKIFGIGALKTTKLRHYRKGKTNVTL